jgi:hypothetical protein
MPKKHSKPNKPKWDDRLMQQLLDEPEVAESVVKMTADELEFSKHMLYKQGTYQRYVLEQQKQQIKELL